MQQSLKLSSSIYYHWNVNTLNNIDKAIYLKTKQTQNSENFSDTAWYHTSKILKPAEKDHNTMTGKNLLDELMFIMQTRAIEIEDIPLWIKATD